MPSVKRTIKYGIPSSCGRCTYFRNYVRVLAVHRPIHGFCWLSSSPLSLCELCHTHVPLCAGVCGERERSVASVEQRVRWYTVCACTSLYSVCTVSPYSLPPCRLQYTAVLPQ